MTRKELAKQIAKNSPLKIADAEKLIIAFGNIVGDTLAKNKKIVYSNFGTFYTVHYPSKVILHPKYGEAKKMVMPDTDAVKWMPAPNIKELANVGFAKESPTSHGKKGQPAPAVAHSTPRKKKEEEEEVEIPIKLDLKSKNIKTEPSKQDVDIFEELMDDGSKLESTFSDVIRVHRSKGKGIFGRVFNRSEQEEPEEDETEIPIEPYQKMAPSYADVSDVMIPSKLMEAIPEKIARLYDFVPIQEDRNMVEIAATDPENKEIADLVKKLTKKNVAVKLATKESIERALSQYPSFDKSQRNAESLYSDQPIYGSDEDVINVATENTPSAKIASTLLRRAIRDEASSVQINPRPDNYEVHFEIGGKKLTKAYVPHVIQKAVAETLKRWAGLDHENVETPQQGELTMDFEGQKVKMEIETEPVDGGEQIVIKLTP